MHWTRSVSSNSLWMLLFTISNGTLLRPTTVSEVVGQLPFPTLDSIKIFSLIPLCRLPLTRARVSDSLGLGKPELYRECTGLVPYPQTPCGCFYLRFRMVHCYARLQYRK